MATKAQRETVDKLGEINARIEQLEHEYDRLAARLVAGDAGHVTGFRFKATFVPAGAQRHLDRAAVVEALGEQWVVDHTEMRPRAAHYRVTPLSAAAAGIAEIISFTKRKRRRA